MSDFLGYEAYLVALGSSIKDVQDNIISVLSTTYGWQVVEKSIVPQAVTGTFGDEWNLNAYAFDNSDWKDCGATTALPRQLQVQMQTAIQVDSYRITGHTAGTSSPKTWTLEYSDNGSAWSVADTQTNITGWLPAEVKSFTVGGSPGAHLYWRLNVSATNGSWSTCYLSEVRLHTTTGYIVNNICYLYLAPPVSESIGNAYSRELIYIQLATTTMTITPVKQRIVNIPTIIGYSEKTAGAVAAAATINGVTVTGAVGTAGSTAKDNLRALYTAIRASADANFTDHKWIYQKASPQNANDALDWIIGVRISDVDQVVYSVNANVNQYLVMQRTKQMIQTQMMTQMQATTLTIDLTNGFIFYWQVNSRSVHVATKTNVGYYGPVHCSYADHAKAIAAMPASLDPRIISPLELLVGYDGASTVLDSFGFPSGIWKLSSTTNTGWDNESTHNATATGDNCFGGGRIRDMFCDGHTSSNPQTSSWALATNPFFNVPLRGSSVFGGADSAADDFQVHRMTCGGITNSISYGDWLPQFPASSIYPTLDVQDWFKFRGTTNNEALMLVADTVTFTTLSAPCTSSDTTLNLTSTTGFPSAGYVVIEQELIQYTGKTAGTLTGCTRGKFGTTANSHYALDPAYLGLWLTIINGGALFAGYNKPA